jgi:mRNA interferase MazF
MGTFTKGEIVLFSFPYTDLTNRKLRPCLVISNEFHDDIILVQITSKKVEKDLYSLEIKKYETINGSLQIDSYVRCNMIFTVNKKQIVKKICSISNKKYLNIISLISKIIK